MINSKATKIKKIKSERKFIAKLMKEEETFLSDSANLFVWPVLLL